MALSDMPATDTEAESGKAKMDESGSGEMLDQPPSGLGMSLKSAYALPLVEEVRHCLSCSRVYTLAAQVIADRALCPRKTAGYSSRLECRLTALH